MLLPLSLLIVFSGAFIDAYAVDYVPDIPAGGKYLSASETISVIGDSFTYRVWTGSDYETRTATYTGTATGFSRYDYLDENSSSAIRNYTDFVTPDTLFMQYSMSTEGLRNNDNYPAVLIDFPFTITDTDYFYTAFCMHGNTITATTSKPVWNWNISGTSTDYSSFFASLNIYASILRKNSSNYMFIPVYYSGSSFSSYSSVSLVVPRASANANTVFRIACPYVSSSGGIQSGVQTTAPVTTPAPSTGTDINVNVDVDMTETNGLLDRIRETLGGLVDGIQGLFVPDEEDVILWKQDIAQILDDTFGGIPQLEGDLQNTVTQLISTQATSSIQIPDLSIPYVGTLITARSVPLKPSGFDVLFDAIRLGADIVVTVWVFNMVQDKIKALLVGETVVDKIGD